MAKRYPREFRDDVVRAARRRDGTLSQIARDFGISDATLHERLRKADLEEGARPGRTEAETTELRELKHRNRVLEQRVEILRCATAYLAKGTTPKGPTRWFTIWPLTGSPSR